jgi:membrane protease YdiL (CAAX protease family)
MDVTAPAPYSHGDDQPEGFGGRRIDWTGRDVIFGLLWFLALFLVAPVPIVLPAIGIWGEESNQVYTLTFVSSAIAEVALVAVAAYFTWHKYGGSWERLGLTMPDTRALLWGVGGLVGALAVSMIYGGLIELFDINALRSDCAEQIPERVRDERALLALAALTVIMFAPICEEIFFRGFVATGLARVWGIAAAIVVSGLLFSGAHFLPKSFLPIALIGMIFALVYWRSGNLWSTVLAHTAFNSLSIALIAAGSCDTDANAALMGRFADLLP